MEAQAIQLIQDTAVAAAAKELNTDIKTVVLPNGMNILSLEKYQALRSRFRGKFRTDSLPDFASFVVEASTEGAQGFISADDMTCRVIFNLGTVAEPGHGDYAAELGLKKTAAFKAMERAAASSHEQKAFSDWLEDWAPNLAAVDKDGAKIEARKAVGAIRSITVEQARKSEHNVGDMSASRSAMDAIEAKSSEGLPAEFQFTCSPFEGLSSRTIVLRLAVLTGGDKPVLRLRWIGEEQLREDLAVEFKQTVSEAIGGSAKLTIGSFDLS